MFEMSRFEQRKLGGHDVTIDRKYAFILNDPLFQSAIETVKTLKPLSVPLMLKNGDETRFFHVRRTRHNHFAFLFAASQNDVNVPQPVLNVSDQDTHRFYLVTTYDPVRSLADYLDDVKVPNSRKLNTLKSLADNLLKLGKAGLRHGNVAYDNIYVSTNGEVMLYDPEMDEEMLHHIQGDLEQFREMLFHLERELEHEPSKLWEIVRNDEFFTNLWKTPNKPILNY